MSGEHLGEETGGAPAEPVGTLAEEAARLVDVLTDWAGHHDPGGTVAGAPECQWCPLCRVVHAVNQVSPEVRQHLATAATSLVQAFGALLDTGTGPDTRPGTGPERAGSRGGDENTP